MTRLSALRDAPPDQDLGGAILLLLLQQADWVHRRVESVHFLDGMTMRRQVSTDYEMPGEDLTGLKELPFVPLALLEKEVLVNFDLVDEAGASLPLLTRSENIYVAWSTLVAAADFEVKEGLGPAVTLEGSLVEDLRKLAGVSLESAESEIQKVVQQSSSPQRRILADSDLFMNIAWDLAFNFLLLVPTDGERVRRTIVKYSYARELEPRAGKRRERLFGKMGWIATQFDFDIPAVGTSESYHFEFTSPPGLPIAESSLQVADAEDETTMHLATLTGARAHAYVSQQDGSAQGVMSIWLRPSRSGLLRASLVTAMTSAIIFWSLLWDDRILKLSGDSAAALLLAIPGIIAAFIVRPGEHGMTTDLVRGIRVQVSLVGGAAYAGALALVGSLDEATLLKTWRALGAVTAICVLSLGVAYRGIQPQLPTEVQEHSGGEDGSG